MRQKAYNEFLKSLDKTKVRFARTVVKKALEAGLKLRNPIHRAAIREIASVDYEIVMAILQEESNDN
jgi:hypothetical protein